VSVATAAVELTNALKTAREALEEARAGWKDAVARGFEERHWTPLDAEVAAVVHALDRLGPVLAKARRDCA
jgi:hypothetical protein